MFPISKAIGNLQECGVYLHPTSNKFLILPAHPLPDPDDPLPMPALPKQLGDENNYVIPLREGDYDFQLNGRRNIVRVTAQKPEKTSHLPRTAGRFESQNGDPASSGEQSTPASDRGISHR